MDKQVELMASVPLFSGLTRKELESICVSCKETTFPAGKEIFHEGAEGVGFHLILEGEVEVIKGEQVEATLGTGKFFGEMSLIDGGPRSATIRTKTPVKTFSLTSWEFRPLVEGNPSIAFKLLEELSRRLRASEKSPTH
jgi:CRP-like cAMP-binding protein